MILIERKLEMNYFNGISLSDYDINHNEELCD